MKLLLVAALSLATALASAAPAEVVVKSTSFGALTLPFTGNFGQTLSPFTGSYGSSDYFIADYGFSTPPSGSFTSAVVTFNLSDILQLSDVTVRLLTGNAWSGAVPSQLSASNLADLSARTIATSTGNATTQTLNATALTGGAYLLEVRGRVTGTAGGSYGGVLNLANISPVPEPGGVILALAGLGFAGVVARRSKQAAR